MSTVTPTSPLTGSSLRAGAVISVSWTAFPAQRQFTIQYRRGTHGTWQIHTEDTDRMSYDIPVLRQDNGDIYVGDFQWKVRVRYGRHSYSDYFEAQQPTLEDATTPVLLDPLPGDTVAMDHDVLWGVPSQTQFQIRRLLASDRSVLALTGGLGAVTRSLSVHFPTEQDEILQLRVFESGDWTPWVEAPITVQFVKPATAPAFSIEPTAVVLAGHIAMTIASDYADLRHEVYRREAGTDSDGDLIAQDITVDGTLDFHDKGVAGGVDYSYRLAVLSASGQRTYSSWSEFTTLFPDTDVFPDTDLYPA